MTADQRQWLTVKEFTERHGVGKNLVYAAVRDSRLPSIRLGGKILIPSDAFERLLHGRADG